MVTEPCSSWLVILIVQQQLINYMKGQDIPYSHTIKPVHMVRSDIIPVAGFGIRFYPITLVLKNNFFPISCCDCMVHPAILIMFKELVQSGIKEICLVLGSEKECRFYADFFECRRYFNPYT